MSQENYIVKPVKDCVSLIESFGFDLLDNAETSLSIDGFGGLIYKLPGKQVVLIPATPGIDIDYVGFVFDDLSSFMKMRDSGRFPVGDKYQTVLEMELDNIKNLPDSIGQYSQHINTGLGIKPSGIDLEYLEKAFHLLPVFVMTSKKKKEYER